MNVPPALQNMNVPLLPAPPSGGNAGSSPMEEDDDLKRALERSKYETSGIQGAYPVSKEEEELNRAIERSLQDGRGDQMSVADIYHNPHFRKREPKDM